MLGYRYLTKSSAEEKLAGVLLCLKELEGKREMEGAVLTHILSTVKADFIARLVCSEEPIARNTGITFLTILPSALSPAFDPYFQALYTHEMKMKKHEISEQSTFVFDFIARSFARHDTQTSSQSMMDFVESVILTTDLSTISQPLSALTLLSQLTSSYPSASPLPQLSSEKAALLRALVMRCMVEGGGAGAFRSQTLAATHSLLTSLTPRWTVDEDGAFAVLLCSLLRNELQLILETEVQGINTSAPPSLPSSSSDRLEDITTSLTHCCHLLDSILSLIAGDDLAVEREGVWESLPSAALLSIRKSVHLIFADFASLLQEEEQQQHSLINSAYTTAVRLLTRSLCHWAACDDSLLDLLFRKLTQILRCSHVAEIIKVEANGEDCTLLSLAELVHNTESTDDCLFNAYGVFSQLVLFSYCALEGHLQDRSLSPLLQAKVALVLGVCTSLLASRSSDLKVLMRGEGDTAFSLLLGVDASDMQRLADNCTAVIQHFEGRIQEMEETDEATAILTTVSYCSGFLQAYSDCNS